MIAADRVVDAAYQRLSGDSTLGALIAARISREPIVPASTGAARFPFITLGIQANTPLMTLEGARVWENMVLRVSLWADTKGAGQGWSMIRQMADRVDTLLQGYRASTGGVTAVKFRLIETDDMVEEEVDGTYLHRTLLFRTEAHA
jgi:hypothetical protein